MKHMEPNDIQTKKDNLEKKNSNSESSKKGKKKQQKKKKPQKYMVSNDYARMASWCFFVDERRDYHDDTSKLNSTYLYLILATFTFKVSFDAYLKYKAWIKLNKSKLVSQFVKETNSANSSQDVDQFIWQKWVQY